MERKLSPEEFRAAYDYPQGIGAPEKILARVERAISNDKPNNVSIKNPLWIGSAIVAASICFFTIKYIPITQSAAAKTYSTAPAQRATITLADGSRVVLAPATTIRVMGVSGRNIDVDGEAMFTVIKHSDVPFTVTTGKSVTRVLGTTFGVRRYAGDKTTRVAVTDGRVSVNSSVISAGDIATADIGGSVQVIHDAERAISALAFAQGKIILDAQSLVEAAPQLGRWLDLDIHITPSISHRLLSVTLSNESPSQVLSMIASLTNTAYTRSGRTVTFTDR